MPVSLHYAARSDIGLGRYKNNQDSGYAGPHLLVVADGMGGAAGGDVASSTVIGELVPLDADGPGPDAARDLEDAILRANDAMRDQINTDPALYGMGATCTALLRTGNHLVLAHVGDSRAYLLENGTLSQVTHDHTFVQRLIDAGQITEDEAERHPQRSVILRVVGHMDGGEVDLETLSPAVGQRWLLCSDGLPRVVTAETIQEALAAGESPEATADNLIALALRAGGPDNITVIVADVVDPATAPPLTPEVVGAAALVRNVPTSARDSAAAKAAALTQAATEPEAVVDDEEDDPATVSRDRPRWVRPVLGLLTVAVLVAASVFGVNRWLKTQYFVGADNDKVAIYQGLDTNLGPLTLSHVYQVENLALSDLTAENRDKVTNRDFGTRSLAEVRTTVSQLWGSSDRCTPAPTPTTSTTQPAPTAPVATHSTAKGTAKPTAKSTPTHASTATGTVGGASPITSATPSSTGTITSTQSPRPTECP